MKSSVTTKVVLGVLVVLMAVSVANAATINVPGDYSTVVDAVKAAGTGDEIVVAANTYVESEIITFATPGVTLTGSGAVTLRAPDDADSVIFVNPGTTDVVLNNVTVDRPTSNADWMRCIALHSASSTTINDCTFAGPANGVGVIIFYGADATLNRCHFSNFNSVSSWAAAIFMEGHDASSPHTDLIVDSCTFDTGCNAWIRTFDNDTRWPRIGEVRVTNCTFRAANHPQALKFRDGGAAAMEYDSTKDILFQDCSFEGFFGGLEIAEFHYTSATAPQSLTFSRCEFKAYDSLRKMFWVDLPTPITFENCLFAGGQHEQIMLVWGGPPSVDFYHCTMITDGIEAAFSSSGTDQSTFIGGWDGGRTFNITNCLFHSPVNYTPGFVGDGGSSATRSYNVSYSVIDHAAPTGSFAQIVGATDYTNDSLVPAFQNPGGRDYHLNDGSPWVDGGVDLGYLLDLDRSSRNQGNAPDMGAYESAFTTDVDQWQSY